MEKQKRLLRRIEYRTTWLLTLVRDLRDGLRAEIKKEKPIQLDLVTVIEKIQDSLRREVEDKALDLRLSFSQSPLFVRSDKGKMELLFFNLMNNAVRYTPTRGKISLKVSKEDCLVRIQISDTGIGIPEQDLSMIFEEFYRAKNARSMEREGTGLGLPIVRRIVEIYGGEITVKSQVGKGTTFSFDLAIGEETSNA